MDTIYHSKKKRIPLLLLSIVGALLLGVAVFASVDTASAQVDGTQCMDEAYGSSTNCTANDVQIAEITVVTLIDGCDYLGDTATAVLQAELVAGANERWDIGLFVNKNGLSAKTDTDPTACYRDYLHPVSADNTDLDVSGGSGPFYNGEITQDPADTCGDIQQGVSTFKTLEQITITCQDNTLPPDGTADVGTCVSWDNNRNTTCTSTLDTLPNTVAKCRCEPIEIADILVPSVRLDIDKSGPATANPGGSFTYTLVYTNVVVPGNPEATNLVISDTLDADLQLVSLDVSDTPAVCYYIDPMGVDPTEYSSTLFPWNLPSDVPYGWRILCNVPNLTSGASGSLSFEVNVVDGDYAERDVFNTACIEGTSVGADPNVPPAKACDTTTTTTPVTVSLFEATRLRKGTQFVWATGSETGNVGFNLYVETAEGRQKVNDTLILSKVVDSLDETEYSFEAPDVQGDAFYIEGVSLSGETRLHGPFELNESYGQRFNRQKIDWAGIGREHQALAAERAAAARKALPSVESAPQSSVQPANLLQRVFNWADSVVQTVFGKQLLAAPETVEASYAAVDLKVKEDGVYRVTYERLVTELGVDLAGAPAKEIALTNAQGSVPIYVGGGATFGPGSYVEFYGEGLDTLYTDTNVYKLQVDAGSAERVAVDNTRLQRKARPADYYMETVIVENNDEYGYLSTNGDPWYDELLFTDSSRAYSYTGEVDVDDYVDAAPAVLVAELWGMSDVSVPTPHHVQLSLNGQLVHDAYFSGQQVARVNEQAPAGAVREGVNAVEFTVPNDQGNEWDMMALESYGLSYPRAFVAREGQLEFSAAGDAFEVSNLNSDRVVVYRITDGQPARLNSVKVSSSAGTYNATFAGDDTAASYFVSTEEQLAVPGMAISRTDVDITSGSYNLLIIAYPSFINTDLDRLVKARREQGYVVKVVDVEDIYAQYSGGVFDAEAIRDYVHYALRNMGVEYVLLVGGDTKDPRDYQELGSISFIPSLYAKTTEDIYFAPVDPLYTDVDGDNIPDAAIGRFPVRSGNQLKWMVDKTLQYDARNETQKTVVLAADAGYEGDSDAMEPAGWDVKKSYIAVDGLDAARNGLIDNMNLGPALVSFVGHSHTDRWTFDPLFTTWDAAYLTNAEPMVVTQWGCFNTYYVDEAYVSLGDNFLLRPNQGAAAVTGATTITKAYSERQLGELLMPKLVRSNMTIGQAMQEAKVELSYRNDDLLDVILGWTILGDPTLVVGQ